jgi:O-antigen/teichoic acid export membrane protein
MYVPYALQLAYGSTRLPLVINVVLVVILVPLLVVLAVTFGPAGGAAAWLVLHACYVAIGSWLTHRKLLPRSAAQWVIRDVGTPLAFTIAVGGAAAVLLHGPGIHPAVRVISALTSAGVAALLSFVASPNLRTAVATALTESRRLRSG